MMARRPSTCPAAKGVATPLAKAQEPAKPSTSAPRVVFDLLPPASALDVSTSRVYLKPACAPPRPAPVGAPSSSPLCTLAPTCPEHPPAHLSPRSCLPCACLHTCFGCNACSPCLLACVACSASLPPNAQFLTYGPVPVAMRLEWSFKKEYLHPKKIFKKKYMRLEWSCAFRP